ncbi:MAG: DUF2064 domain-containing protein [Gemmatimonadetes bacterium]|nr:DUF2064 domain-containing protein [Gemmatimonadota bacterium]
MILLGGDCRGITTELLVEAGSALAGGTTVLGPSVDGGYYLLGSLTPLPDLFSGIAEHVDRARRNPAATPSPRAFVGGTRTPAECGHHGRCHGPPPDSGAAWPLATDDDAFVDNRLRRDDSSRQHRKQQVRPPALGLDLELSDFLAANQLTRQSFVEPRLPERHQAPEGMDRVGGHPERLPDRRVARRRGHCCRNAKARGIETLGTSRHRQGGHDQHRPDPSNVQHESSSVNENDSWSQC